MNERPNELPDLRQFTGTEQWYRHPLFQKFLYTDGMQHVAETAEAYWLLDLIFMHAQRLYRKQQANDERLFLTFNLAVKDDNTAILTADDGNDQILAKQEISYTDFPAKSFDCYVADYVCLLPSEY